MRVFVTLVVVAICLTNCEQSEPDQATIEQVGGDFRIWDERRLKKIKSDALQGDKISSYVLVGYYLRYSTFDIDFAAKNYLVWANNSYRLFDCRGLEHLHSTYTQGWQSGERVVDGAIKVEYAIRPSLKQVRFLERMHAEWKCPKPLYPNGYDLDDSIRIYPDLKKSG